jgi:CheY-like chemotaxis protein
MGYTVDFAASGSEAIQKYREVLGSPVPHAFVIPDPTIPGGLGGKQVVQELLKLDPQVVAIAASGYSEDPVMTDPLEFGFKGRIRKLFTKDELGEELERVTNRK